MSLNKNDKKEIVKLAQSKGYDWNADSSKMINGHGKSVTFSETGGSIKINDSHQNTVAGAKNSTKW